MVLFWLIVKAFAALYVALLIPQSLDMVFTTRTAPGWDCRGHKDGLPDVWMPDGIPVPFFGPPRLLALLFVAVYVTILYFLVPDVYRTVSGLLLRG